MRTTIKDVANRAGFSPATVSLVLNERPVSIPQQTRDAVIKAAKELNYHPNQLAVALVKKKTNTIGIIIPDNSNLFLSTYSNKLETFANQKGYSVILGNANDSIDNTLFHLQAFADRGVDGIILMQTEFSTKEETQRCISTVQNLSTPVLPIDRVPADFADKSIILDHFKGGYMSAKHLLDLGHRRIGYITGPLSLNLLVQRLEGCKKALAEANVPFDPALVFESDLQLNSGITALPYLLGQNVTAIVAFNDMIAYGVYKELRNYQLNIPDDVSLVGFDDLLFSDIIQPPLTTSEQPLEEMARFAISQLINIIEKKDYSLDFPQLFSPILKVRGSTKRLLQEQNFLLGVIF